MARRIAGSIIALVTLLLSVVAVPLGLHIANQDRSDFAHQTTSTAVTVASVAEEHLDDHESGASLDQAVRELEQHGDQVTVYGRGGGLVAGRRVVAGVTRHQLHLALTTSITHSYASAERLVVISPVLRDGSTANIGAVVLARSTEPLDQRIDALWGWLALISAAGLAAAVATAIAIARWLSTPLGVLAHAAEQLGDGQFSVRSPTDSGPPEVRKLADNFNLMAGRLETLVTGHQAMIADVSHQLRTPLTALRLRLDVLELQAPPPLREELADAQGEITRLSRLVDGLLAVARAENATSPPGPVPIAEIISDRVAAWRPTAADKPVSLSVDVTDGLTARLGDGHLEQILDNLLANAIEAVPAAAGSRSPRPTPANRCGL